MKKPIVNVFEHQEVVEHKEIYCRECKNLMLVGGGHQVYRGKKYIFYSYNYKCPKCGCVSGEFRKYTGQIPFKCKIGFHEYVLNPNNEKSCINCGDIKKTRKKHDERIRTTAI